MDNKIEIRVMITKEVYYKEETMWGIFGCKPLTNVESITLNGFGNFTIRGTCRRLQEQEEYDVIVTGPHKNPNPKFDDFYEIVEVKPEKLNSVEAQHKFLRALVTERQAEILIKAYPDEMIVDLIIEGEMDISKTKGIKEKALESIREKVMENQAVSALITELADANFTANAISKIVEYYESADLALNMVKESMYNLCDITGFGFIKVDGYAMNRGESKTSTKRIRAAITYLLKEESQDGHVWTDREELVNKAYELLDINRNDIELYISKNDNGLYVEGNRVSLLKLYKDEKRVLEHLVRINDDYQPDRTLNIHEYIQKAEEKQGFIFTEEQTEAILDAMNHGVYIINGKAGSGKSTVVTGIVSILEGIGKSYVSTALSGKAAQVLSQKGLHAMTIHRTLKAKGFNKFTYDEYHHLPYDCIILDETSMVNAGLFYKLISAIKHGAKLIVVGDSGQLSGIGHGDVMRDLLNTSYFKKRELIKIHRQAEASGIITVASDIREGKTITKYNSPMVQTYGELQDQTVMTFSSRETVADVLHSIIDSYKDKLKTYDDIMDFQILVPNRDRGDLSMKAVNLYAQTVFNNLDKPSISRGGYDYREGDKVIAKGNTYDIKIYHTLENYNNPTNMFEHMLDFDSDISDEESMVNPDFTYGDLFNGTMGVIVQVDEANKSVLVEFQGIEGVICLNQDAMDKIQMAYAITVHSSQGSSIPNVVVAIDFVAFKLLSRQIVYTAITRSSRKCVLVAENNALHKATQTDLSGNRRTYLADMINNLEKGCN